MKVIFDTDAYVSARTLPDGSAARVALLLFALTRRMLAMRQENQRSCRDLEGRE